MLIFESIPNGLQQTEILNLKGPGQGRSATYGSHLVDVETIQPTYIRQLKYNIKISSIAVTVSPMYIGLMDFLHGLKETDLFIGGIEHMCRFPKR